MATDGNHLSGFIPFEFGSPSVVPQDTAGEQDTAGDLVGIVPMAAPSPVSAKHYLRVTDGHWESGAADLTGVARERSRSGGVAGGALPADTGELDLSGNTRQPPLLRALEAPRLTF